MHKVWIANGGRTVCDKHLGFYGEQVLKKYPYAVEVTTPIDHWVTMFTDDDSVQCETCYPIRFRSNEVNNA